jgi:hypothetical protein
MANPQQGEVVLTVGHRHYTLVMGMAGLALLQKRLSLAGSTKKLTQVVQEALAGLDAESVEHIVLLILAGLQKHHPEFSTEAQVMNLIDDMGGVEALGDQLTDAAAWMKPDPEDVKALSSGQKANPRKAQTRRRGTGGRSTSTPAVSV